MSLINATAIHNGAAFEIEQSLRFNDDDSAYLGRTPASDGNRKTMTFSFWSKRGDFAEQRIFGASSDNYIAWSASDQIELNLRNGGSSSNAFVITTAKYRDFSAWYHVVVAIDTTQSTAANRVKIYVNGEQETLLGTATYPSQNNDINNFNRNTGQFIGKFLSGSPYDGYLAEVNFIDGQGLTPNSFGETGTYGEWKPKKYRGTYGTNGFHLPFKNDYTVEGFSTVTYKGEATDKYIGGVGFQPDLTWIKRRNASAEHILVDSVRGNRNLLSSDGTGAELDRSYFKSFDNDGFSVETAVSNLNLNGSTYVAWNWDMGNSYGTPVTITASGSAQHQTGTGAPVGASSIYIGVNNYLSMPDDKKYDFQGDFTVECYIKRNGTQSGSAAILSKYEVAGWILEVAASTNKVQWRDQNDGSSNMTSTTVLTTATWYHVAVTRQNDMFMMFIDGVLEDTKGTDYNYSISGMNQTLKLGRYSNANSNAFDGWVDEVRISNKARYVSNFTPSTTAFSNDGDTILLIHSNTSNGSTTFVDSSGAAVNTSGSITSSVSANQAYGQSIVKYTGTGSAATVGHGLASAPDMIICKSDTNGYNWPVYHSGLASAAHTVTLDITAASAVETNKFNGTAPTSSVFSVGTHGTNVSNASQIAYCFHDVTGYSKFGSYTANNSAAGPTVTLGFSPAFVIIKDTEATNNWIMYDNTRDPSNPNTAALFPDTTQAEAQYGAIDFNATGFQIKSTVNALNSGGREYIYAAFADTREYAYWLDQSGNNNDWTSNNLTESDVMVDSPTNNFATLNPLVNVVYNPTLSEGNLKTTYATASNWNGSFGTVSVSSGKYYWELISGGSGYFAGLFLDDGTVNYSASPYTYAQVGMVMIYGEGGSSMSRIDNNDISGKLFGGTSVGDVVGVAVDMDNGTFKAYNNNVLKFTMDMTASGHWGAPMIPAHMQHSYAGSSSTYNFGQDSSFAGAKTAQGNQDGNDIGDFYYAPPTGFLALCTKNLPSADVIPSENFNTVLYTGNDSTNVITGVGFKSDLSWWKKRNAAADHALIDSVRGVTKHLVTNTTTAEITANVGTELVSFDSDGFTLGAAAQTNSINGTSASIVAWNWKAGGATPSKTYAVTVVSDSGNKYRFDGFGTSAVALDLQEGGTYKFDQSHSSNSNHPFRFSTTSNGSHGGGSEYTTGVTTSGTPGNSGAYTQITVASGAATLYYYCTNHSNMGGQANTNSTYGSSNFSGAIQSTSSANVDAGFSIVSWTSNGSNGLGVGHGLSSAPQIIIYRPRNQVNEWYTWLNALVDSSQDYVRLNNTIAKVDINSSTYGVPSSTLISNFGFTNNITLIAYCFHSVDGYSKVGSYTGNGSTDGTFVYTGFRPAFVMWKNTAAATMWQIYDTERAADNVMSEYLQANASNAEASYPFVDFTSNGFKHRHTSGHSNGSGVNYIYLAFAETPFKHSNAR